MQMENKGRFKTSLNLFLTFLKLGTFSIGGGPAIIALLRDELVIKKKMISDEELIEMISISESTPGPLAVNLATYLGYKLAGLLGGLLATLGVIFTPFWLMFIVSLFLRNLLEIEAIQYAFMGINCAVIYLIIKVGISLFKKVKVDWISILLFILVLVAQVLFHIFHISFLSIFYILGGAVIGLIVYGFINVRRRKE